MKHDLVLVLTVKCSDGCLKLSQQFVVPFVPFSGMNVRVSVDLMLTLDLIEWDLYEEKFIGQLLYDSFAIASDVVKDHFVRDGWKPIKP